MTTGRRSPWLPCLTAAIVLLGGATGCFSGTGRGGSGAPEPSQSSTSRERNRGAQVPEQPQDLIVDVDGDGMTVSWLAVDGATDGYAVAVDGGWRTVAGTKVHFEEYLPGLPYRVEVAAVAHGRRGPGAVTEVDPTQGRAPPAIMDAPLPPPAAGAASENGLWPSERQPLPGAAEMAPPVGVSANGCGFAADGRVDLVVEVVLPAEALIPALLMDDADRTYLPAGMGSPPATPPDGSAPAEPSAAPAPAAGQTRTIRFAPVATGPPPDRTVVDRMVFLTGPAGQERGYAQHRIDDVRWGAELCSEPVSRLRW